MIKGRNPGDNITLLNSMFIQGTNPSSGKFEQVMTLVYKDLDSGMKHVEEISDPDYEYYMIHPDNRVDYNRLFVPKTEVDKITVPFGALEKDIALRLGMKDFYFDNIRTGNRGENRKLHIHPDVFNSDMNIEDHYKFRFDKMYQNQTFPITKAFLDIEADTINMMGDFPEPGECPINAITLICQDISQVYTFLLRTKSNPQIAEFEKQVNDGSIFSELKEFVIQAVGGPEVAVSYEINFNYNFLFYDEDDEINLIKDLFVAINMHKPDFALAWNMGFDIPYIIQRIINLGYDPCDIMCHPDFKHKIVKYFVDERMKNELAERGDFAAISCYTVYLDQMIQFASRRKGQSKFLSFSLDYIGEHIAGVRKLDYKEITTNIAELPYKSYKTFVFYNIIDTIVQHCIEMKTKDIDYVFGKALLNNTRYSKVHRQSVYLTNRACKVFESQGFIIGNNANKFNSKPDAKFPGAFVADPEKINNDSRLQIYGLFINLFDNCVDFDFASLYPSIIRQFNIAANTIIGKLIIDEKVHDKENISDMDKWTRASAFMEDIQSQQWLEFASRWFNLPDYTTLYHEIERFFTQIANAYLGLRVYERDGTIEPIAFDQDGLLCEPIIFEDDRREVVDIYRPQDLTKWMEWRNHAIMHPNQQFK